MTAVVHSFATVLQYVRKVISGENSHSSKKSLKTLEINLNGEQFEEISRNCCAGDLKRRKSNVFSESTEDYGNVSVFEEADEYYEQSSHNENSSKLSSTDTMFDVPSLPYTESEGTVESSRLLRKQQRREFLRRRYLRDSEFRERCKRVRVVRKLQIRPTCLTRVAAIQKKAIYYNRYLGEDMSSYESWTWSE